MTVTTQHITLHIDSDALDLVDRHEAAQEYRSALAYVIGRRRDSAPVLDIWVVESTGLPEIHAGYRASTASPVVETLHGHFDPAVRRFTFHS